MTQEPAAQQTQNSLEDAIFYPEKTVAPRPRTTELDRYKKRIETTTDTYGDQKIIHMWAKDICKPAFYLIGTQAEGLIWEVIAAQRLCIKNDTSAFVRFGQRISDIRNIIFGACLTETPKLTYGLTTIEGPSANFFSEIQRLKPLYRPLKANEIPENLTNHYGQLLRLEQAWGADLFLSEIPAANGGAGRIAVRHFIEVLGGILAMFKDPKAEPGKIEAQFTRLDAAKSVIKNIAQEVF